MSFDRTLGNVQIASDFGVVAPLEQKVDDLLLAGPLGGGDHFLHRITPQKSRAVSRQWRFLADRRNWVDVHLP